MTPGQVTSPILWGLCLLAPLVLHSVWRSYPLATLVAALAVVVLDQIALQIAFILMEGQANAYGIARMFFFFPVALIFAHAIGLPFFLIRRRRGGRAA